LTRVIAEEEGASYRRVADVERRVGQTALALPITGLRTFAFVPFGRVAEDDPMIRQLPGEVIVPEIVIGDPNEAVAFDGNRRNEALGPQDVGVWLILIGVDQFLPPSVDCEKAIWSTPAESSPRAPPSDQRSCCQTATTLSVLVGFTWT
jgi:hypothetical protein